MDQLRKESILSNNLPAHSVSEAILTRSSIRQFTSQPVSHDTITEILDVARFAPSGGNLQPWKVHVLNGSAMSALKNLLAQRLKMHPVGDGSEYFFYPVKLKQPYKGYRSKYALDLHKLFGIGRKDRKAKFQQMNKNYQFFDAPAGLIFTIDRQMQQGQFVDLGIFMQSFMLLAREKGLHTCPQKVFANWSKTLHHCLQIPSEHMVFGGMAIGYVDPNAAVNRLVTDRAGVNDFTVFLDDKNQLPLKKTLEQTASKPMHSFSKSKL